ncbi:MAG: hypothetical protein ACJ8FY_12305 [Gemmataceae bacterium]
MHIKTRWAVALYLTALLPLPSRADESFADLMAKAPDSANAICLINISGIKNSPIGKRENLASKHESEYLAGTAGINPKVQKLVLAASVDPSSLQNTWEAAVVSRSDTISMEKLAKAHSGSLDKVNGQAVVFTPRNAAFVQFEPKVGGVMRPANRQAVARWVRSVKTAAKPGLSPYLLAAAGKTKESQIIMAVDLSDMFDEEGIAYRLKNSKTLGNKGDITKQTKVIAGIKGLTFTVDFTQTLLGQLQIDFADDVKPIKFLAKTMVLEAFDNIGAHIDDISDWYVEAEGASVKMRGKMTPKGIRQIISFITPPADAVETVKDDGSPLEANQDPKLVASQRYLAAITSYLGDLRDQKTKNFEGLAVWYDRYSQKIDNLPVLDVDSDLLHYGSNVSNTLRAISQSARGVPIKQGVLTQQETHIQGGGYTPYNYGYANSYGAGYGTAWGYQYLDVSNYKAVQDARKNVNSGEYLARMDAWKMLDTETARIRKEMTLKYKVEFKTGGSQLKTD